MIKLENIEVIGWEHAIRGMRNPMNSWDRGGSSFGAEGVVSCDKCPYDGNRCLDNDYAYCVNIGKNDHKLMMKLRNAGTDHRKFMRIITVYVDITAPLYWWKEFDTYRVGVEKNSCSTMHKIHDKEFTIEDFSCEHLFDDDSEYQTIIEQQEDLMNFRGYLTSSMDDMEYTIGKLNAYRIMYLRTNDKIWWHQMIKLLPSSYNQKRTVMLNYEVLANMYRSRKNHKLDEWVEFCTWIEKLPYSEIITGEIEKKKGDKNDYSS